MKGLSVAAAVGAGVALSCCRAGMGFVGTSVRLSPISRTSSRPIGASPMSMVTTIDDLKKQVGYKAVDDYVKSGMVVGLGTGSTAAYAVERVGQKLKSGELKDIVGIPTSIRTKEQAESLGIPLTTLDSRSDIDVSIDGADTVDTKTLALVKGGGGALLREKMVEIVSKKFIVIVDETKLADGLGPHFDLPVEITQFCHDHTRKQIESLPSLKGCKAVLRLDGSLPYITDNGNFILDLKFNEAIKDLAKAQEEMRSLVGVVEHGLFLGMTSAVIVASSEGIKLLE